MRRANEGESKHTLVTYGALYRAIHPPTVAPRPVGRRTLVSHQNELKIKEAVIFYQERGLNITKQKLREAVATIIAELPEPKLAMWKHDRPGEWWARSFCERHGLCFLAENRLDATRARATTKENYGKHFSMHSHLISTHNITPDRLSNWDESGFSFEKMAAGRAKVIVCTDIGWSLTRGVNVGADAEHITLGAAVTADGHAYSAIFVLPGTPAKFRELGDGRTETLDDSLPRRALILYRT